MRPLVYTGKALLIVGAAAVPVSLFLDYYSGSGVSVTGWKAFRSSDIVVAAIAGAVIALTIVSFFVARRTLLLMAVSLAFVLVGWFIPDRSDFEFLDVGYWLGIAGTAVAVCGGALAVVGELASRSDREAVVATPSQSVHASFASAGLVSRPGRRTTVAMVERFGLVGADPTTELGRRITRKPSGGFTVLPRLRRVRLLSKGTQPRWIRSPPL